MRRSWIIGALGAAVLTLGSASAMARQPNVEICHINGNGTYRLIAVAAPAVPAHMAHGDAQPGDPVPGHPGHVFDGACGPQIAEAVFAVAYSDIDGREGFDPDTGDVLISKVVDGNGNGVLDAGDEIVMGRYPKNFDATEFGDFGIHSHTVATHFLGTLGLLVRSDDGHEFFWEDSDGEQFYELVPGTHLASDWAEFAATGYDLLRTNITGPSPSEPDATLYLERTGNTSDDAFIEVIVHR
jgi:hypothetical protein